MSALEQYQFYVPRYKIRKETDDYIVRFENQDEYYVVNETGKIILEYLRGNPSSLLALNTFLESEFSDFTQNSQEEIIKFFDSLEGLSIIRKK